MRILAGLHAPDGGQVALHGRVVTGWSATEAIAAGVGMVHQHFMLVPTLTVAENVVLGLEPKAGVRFDRQRAEVEVESLCRSSGLMVDPKRLVADLSVGEAQRVEILKVLYRGAKLLILDEPTAVLSPPEVDELWRVLRTVRDNGGTIVLITHKLDEVLAVSDTITVMRGGTTVARMATAGTTPRDIARAMVGRDVQLSLDAVGGARPAGSPARAGGAPVLRVQGLTVTTDRGSRAVDNVSFDVQAGEILGIAGVEGNGQTELLEAIAGLRRPTHGSVHLGPHDLTTVGVRERADCGLSHIPEDRHRRGLVLDYSIAENLVLGQQHHFARFGRLDREQIDRNAADRIARFDIRPADPSRPARALSAGISRRS